MSERNVHFYHVYAIDGWKPVVHEHLDAMYRTDLVLNLAEFYVGLVGPQRAAAAIYIQDHIPCKIAGEAEQGWEQVTLRSMWRWAQTAEPANVLYTHTKGISRVTDANTAWRREMETSLVLNWKDALVDLESHDAVGCRWMIEHDHYPYGIFAGNFWWVKSETVKTFRQPFNDYRYGAEAWLGQNGIRDIVDRSARKVLQ